MNIIESIQLFGKYYLKQIDTATTIVNTDSLIGLNYYVFNSVRDLKYFIEHNKWTISTEDFEGDISHSKAIPEQVSESCFIFKSIDSIHMSIFKIQMHTDNLYFIGGLHDRC